MSFLQQMARITDRPIRWHAQWIWDSGCIHGYNEAVMVRRKFELDQVPDQATLSFSADSTARVFINNMWIADGPCRGWPHAYYFESIEVGKYLQPGRNEIFIIARYFGVGTFHQVPQQSGVIAQIETWDSASNTQSLLVSTDTTWDAAKYAPWRRETPKVCIQLGPFEWHDARKETEQSAWAQAVVVCGANDGPWGVLRQRDVRLPGQRKIIAPPPVMLREVASVEALPWAVPVTQLCHPGMIAANTHTNRGCALATVIHADRDGEIPWDWPDWIAFVGGQECRDVLPLKSGANPALFFVRKLFHNTFDAIFAEPAAPWLHCENPLNPGADFPWCFVPLPECDHVENDLWWQDHPRSDRTELCAHYEFLCREGAEATSDKESFISWLRAKARVVRRQDLAWEDPHAAFERRAPISCYQPKNLQFPVQIAPKDGRDIELEFDLGEQVSGFYEIEVESPEDTVFDLFAVEHVAADGRVQHLRTCRNGFRYISKGGRQVFRSLLKRFGRHLFLTIRQLRSPATVHRVAITESLYPAKQIGSFVCSDPQLNRIWEVSKRTMELCMDDVFVDSLYEQTLWVGDSMVQQIYALGTFDARDISVRSMRLAAQSLERLPMVGAQVPSSWETIIPAWSFLWGISVWDYFQYTGETDILREMWPAVRRNLLGAESYLNASGLFDAPFWNLLEWAPIQFTHTCVLYNSMLMAAAVDAAVRCGEILGKTDDLRWLHTLRNRLAKGLKGAFDLQGGFFPDSILADGSAVGCSLHPQFLALLFDLVEPELKERLSQFLKTPPSHAVDIASPFMTHFLYGAWDQLGEPERILDGMRRHFGPMIDAGESTLWETLPGAIGAPEGWPTRSRCHGWSASPLYYLPRTVLGIRAVGQGSNHFEIHPHLGDLMWAEGTIATPHGPLHVKAERCGEKIEIAVSAPAGVRFSL